MLVMHQKRPLLLRERHLAALLLQLLQLLLEPARHRDEGGRRDGR